MYDLTVTIHEGPTVPDEDRPQPLQRAKTTITVAADVRERIRGASGGATPNPPSPVEKSPREPVSTSSPTSGAPLARSMTTASATGRNIAGAAPARGLSVRRPGAPTPALVPAAVAALPPPVAGARRSPADINGARSASEFYDEYIDSYGRTSPGSGNGRAADWARNAPSSRGRSSYAPSSQASVRRRVTKRTAPPRRSVYEEEEEGYGSGGDYDEFEMTKIRIKVRFCGILFLNLTWLISLRAQLHYQDDVRGMAIDAAMTFEDFMDRITAKFDKSFNGLGLKFKDEDGGKVTLQDESDYELAIETARESAKGKPEGRLEIWCIDK